MSEIETAAQKLRTVIRLLIRRAYTEAGEEGPTRSEQGVLAWLDEKGDMTPSALAAIEKVRPQTMGQTLDALSRHEWIERNPHPTDRRQVLISLSPSGRKALSKGRELRQAWLVTEMGKLNVQDRKTLIAAIDLLDRMVQS
jgi:DNA-binding MarR family transcriptional regulator